MPLMGSLYVGVSGLQTSQNALNTTAHNLSNIETTGYVRQQTLLEDREYHTIGNAAVSAKQTGLGVEYADVRQVRDAFLDLSYREEAGRKSFYDIAYETTNEIETLMGELEGASFNTALGNLWTAIQELDKDPTSAVVQGQFVTTSAQFLERAQAVYDGLCEYQDNLNARVQDLVDKINEYGERIHLLNQEIKRTEIGLESANDMRDERNLLIDKLSEIANVSYSEDIDGVMEVSIEGVPFVGRDRVFEMGTKQVNSSGFITACWPWNNDVDVFDLTRPISSEFDTDIGELKSILLMRGDRRANYSDMSDDTVIGGNHYDVFSEGFKDENGNEYLATSTSVIMEVQAELDVLVQSVATKINDILCNEQTKEPLQRFYANEKDLPIEMFERLGSSRYEYIGTTDADHPQVGWYYVDEDTSHTPVDVSTMYTISNMKINPDLLKEPTLLSFMTADKQADKEKASALTKAFQDDFGTLIPTSSKEYSYQEYYNALVSRTGNTGFVYKTIVNSQETTVQGLENARQAVAGVSSNEELSNMIRFQNAYNAASRYINAIDAMLEHLVNRLA